MGADIVRAAAPLTADWHDSYGFFNGLPNGFGVFHGVGHWLFDVRVAAGAHSLDAMERVLEIPGGDNHRVDVFALVEFLVLPGLYDLVTDQLANRRGSFVAAPAPNIRHRHQIKIELLCMQHECRE